MYFNEFQCVSIPMKQYSESTKDSKDLASCIIVYLMTGPCLLLLLFSECGLAIACTIMIIIIPSWKHMVMQKHMHLHVIPYKYVGPYAQYHRWWKGWGYWTAAPLDFRVLHRIIIVILFGQLISPT